MLAPPAGKNGKKASHQAAAPDSQLALDWMPWPGRHVLELLNHEMAVVDQVRFEVRGAVENLAPQKSGRSGKK
jgi:penicillin-binding protein 1C